VCLTLLPDADRMISRFAGMQFLLEGISMCILLRASVGSAEEERGSAIWITEYRDVAFAIALSAMAVPVMQLLEQRFVTPTVNIVLTRNCNVLALCAAAYMLGMSIPRQVKKFLMFIAGHEDPDGDDAGTGETATADAGDDAAEDDNTASGGVSGQNVDDAIAKASKLAARALAAKEVAAKQMSAPPSTPSDLVVPREQADTSLFRTACTASQLVRRRQEKLARDRTVAEEQAERLREIGPDDHVDEEQIERIMLDEEADDDNHRVSVGDDAGDAGDNGDDGDD